LLPDRRNLFDKQSNSFATPVTSETTERKLSLICSEIQPMHSVTHNKEESGLSFAAGADSKPQPIFRVTYATKTLFRKKRAV